MEKCNYCGKKEVYKNIVGRKVCAYCGRVKYEARGRAGQSLLPMGF